MVWEESQKPKRARNIPPHTLHCHPTTNTSELIIKESVEVGFLNPHPTPRELKSHQAYKTCILTGPRDLHAPNHTDDARCMVSLPSTHGPVLQITSLDLPSQNPLQASLPLRPWPTLLSPPGRAPGFHHQTSAAKIKQAKESLVPLWHRAGAGSREFYVAQNRRQPSLPQPARDCTPAPSLQLQPFLIRRLTNEDCLSSKTYCVPEA